MSTEKQEISQEGYEELTAFIQSNQESFYRLAYSYGKNKDTALDMVQIAIYNALRSLNTLKDPSYMKTWFYRILVNASIDELRKNKRMIPTDPADLPEVQSKESIGADARLDLYAALDQLDDHTKTIITLRYFEDMKLSQVSAILDENINTVKTKLYKGLEKLKIQLEGEIFKDE